MSPMRHGDAERIAELCAEAGKPLQPWQHCLLQQIEERDIDVQFAKMVRGFNR